MTRSSPSDRLQPPGGRFVVLDGWRGICAILVMLHHLAAAGHFYDWAPVRRGYLAVDFFFVLSGFVIAHAYGARLTGAAQAGAFMLRRFGRLYPLHLAMIAALIGLQLIKLAASGGVAVHDAAFSGKFGLEALGANLLLLNGLGVLGDFTWNQPSWSISTEFYTYLVFVAVCLAFGRRRFVAAGLALVVALGAWLVWNQAQARPLPAIRGAAFITCIFGFFLGALVQRLWAARRPPAWLEWPALAAVVLVFVVEPPLKAISPLLVFAVFIYALGGEGGGVSRLSRGPVFAWLGEISYSIYLVHGVVLTALYAAVRVIEAKTGWSLFAPALDDLGPRLAFGGPWALDALAVVYAALVLALSTLTYRRVERPARDWFNGLARAAPSPAAA